MENDKIIKKLTLKIRYLTLELEEVKEIMHECNAEWMEYLYHLQNQYDIEIYREISEKVKKNESRCLNKDIKVNKKHDKNQDKIFKSMYRDIAKRAHPDLNEDDEVMARIMRHATEAKNKDDLITLLDICDDLDIDKPKINDNHIKIIENNIKSKENEIAAIKKTDAWIWRHADSSGRSQLEKAIIKKYKLVE